VQLLKLVFVQCSHYAASFLRYLEMCASVWPFVIYRGLHIIMIALEGFLIIQKQITRD